MSLVRCFTFSFAVLLQFCTWKRKRKWWLLVLPLQVLDISVYLQLECSSFDIYLSGKMLLAWSLLQCSMLNLSDFFSFFFSVYVLHLWCYIFFIKSQYILTLFGIILFHSMICPFLVVHNFCKNSIILDLFFNILYAKKVPTLNINISYLVISLELFI